MEIFDGNTTTESEFYKNINIAVQSNSVAQSLLSDLLRNISLVLEDIRTEKNRQNFVSPFPSIDARLRQEVFYMIIYIHQCICILAKSIIRLQITP